MIRLSTCVSVVLACGSGLYLYQTKHQAQVLDRQIEHTVKDINQARMQTRELSASWTLLGSPDRLQLLSDQFLGIKPVMPSQFVAMSDIDLRLAAPRTLETPLPDTPASGAAASGTPDDTGSDTTPVATTDPASAPDTPTTPASLSPAPIPRGPSMPAPTVPAATSRAVAAATLPGSSLPAPSSAAPWPNPAADAARAQAVTTASPSPAPVTDSGKAATLATARPADRRPGETTHPGHDPGVRDQGGHDQAHEVAQVRPPAPRPATPSPFVAALERPSSPTSQRLAPVPTSGSMLGMARAVGRPPVPLPVSITPALEVSH